MQRYLLIESRDSFGRERGGFCVELARALVARGDTTTVLLVQNGVLAARKSVRGLARLAEAGVTLLADDFSLRERGITTEDLADGVHESGIDALVEAIVREKTKAVWH